MNVQSHMRCSALISATDEKVFHNAPGCNLPLGLIMLRLVTSPNSFHTVQLLPSPLTPTWPRTRLSAETPEQHAASLSVPPPVVNEGRFCLCLDELIREGCATAQHRLSSRCLLDGHLHHYPGVLNKTGWMCSHAATFWSQENDWEESCAVYKKLEHGGKSHS